MKLSIETTNLTKVRNIFRTLILINYKDSLVKTLLLDL